MTIDEKRVVATSISTTIVAGVVLFILLDTNLDKFIPINITFLSSSFRTVEINIADAFLLLLAISSCTLYFRRRGIKPLYFKGPGYKYDSDNSYKISKKFQALRIIILFLVAFLFIGTIFLAACLTGTNIYC